MCTQSTFKCVQMHSHSLKGAHAHEFLYRNQQLSVFSHVQTHSKAFTCTQVHSTTFNAHCKAFTCTQRAFNHVQACSILAVQRHSHALRACSSVFKCIQGCSSVFKRNQACSSKINCVQMRSSMLKCIQCIQACSSTLKHAH